MSASVLEHGWLSHLLGDQEGQGAFTDETELRTMLDFERALAETEAELGIIPQKAATAIVSAIETFEPDWAALGEGARQDGVVVPALVKQLRKAVGEAHGRHVHKGATSQDVIDTSLALRLKTLIKPFDVRVGRVIEALNKLEAEAGGKTIWAQTRMQRALEISAADKIAGWRQPLANLAGGLPAIGEAIAVVQLGGPVGNGSGFEGHARELRAMMAERLGLGDPGYCWHADRARITTFANWLCQLSGALGKMGQDIALLAQTENATIKLEGGGGSSAMPHKNNPVSAEILVTLARFNAAQLGGLSQALVHENERSGAAWTLEWMILPQMVVAALAGLRHAGQVLDQSRFV
ncbi:3-carboxy-cis,cis-muconate cycloisomerase [Cucumibacter marinus]|uniref:3-carboxy-cis,cis-muconate cycloisomerase n=1 Tax=Cucumibacter marinus TaxID=1121252 RepID=UPI0003F68B3C|nr:3-carboxy-cis,cis-muconate cycloisomerase [Cucumibacter marinus]